MLYDEFTLLRLRRSVFIRQQGRRVMMKVAWMKEERCRWQVRQFGTRWGRVSNRRLMKTVTRKNEKLRARTREDDGISMQSCVSCRAASPSSASTSSLSSSLRSLFSASNALPILLVSATTFGLLAPQPGVMLVRACPHIETLAASGIFLISGASIQPRQAAAVGRYWKMMFASSMVVLVVTPILGCSAVNACTMFVEAHALGGVVSDLAMGFCVLSCAPTTLSSCVTLAGIAGGPTGAAAALILTVVTNAVAVLTMPIMLAWLTRSSIASLATSIDPIPLMKQLVCVVLLPTAVGAIIRATSSVVRRLVQENRSAISILSSVLLCTVPWIQISKATVSGALSGIGAGILATATLGGLALHLMMLVVSAAMVRGATPMRWLRSDVNNKNDTPTVDESKAHVDDTDDAEAIRRAATLVGGQKTLPVSLTVLSQLGAAINAFPIAMLPLLITHFAQIVIDSAVVSAWGPLRTMR